MVLDRMRHRLQSVKAPSQGGGDGGGAVGVGLAHEACRLGGRRGVHDLHAMKPVLQEPPALGEATGIETTRRMSPRSVPGGARRSRCTSRTCSSWMKSSTSKTRLIQAGADRSLDRVLDRDEGRVDLATVRGVEAVGDRRHRDGRRTDQGGDGQKRLF